MAFKDVHQGAAAIVFLIVFAVLAAVNIYGMVTRRPRRRFISGTIFASIRVGANIAGIGWSIVLYDDFAWLIATLVLGAEGYFALIFALFLHMYAYEMENFGSSWLAPKTPPGVNGVNKVLFRIKTPAFLVEQVLVAANVLVVVGGSKISSGLSSATYTPSLNFADIPGVKQGRQIRTAGQALFLACIIIVYMVLGLIMRKANRLNKDVTLLWWMASTAPFMLLRGAFGVLSTAAFSWSYYDPANYGVNGLLNRQLVAEYVWGSTTEAVTAIILVIIGYKMTVPIKKHVDDNEKDEGSPIELNEAKHAAPREFR